MGIDVNTGIVTGNTVSSCAVRSFDDTNPIENVIYPTDEERYITVNAGEMVVFTAYNVPNQFVPSGTDGEAKIAGVYFRKVLRSAGVPPHGTSDCCPDVTVGRSIKLQSVDIPCWAITACNPIFALYTVGTYEIYVVGDTGDITVTAEKIPMQDINEMCQTLQPICQPQPLYPAPQPDFPKVPEPSH